MIVNITTGSTDAHPNGCSGAARNSLPSVWFVFRLTPEVGSESSLLGNYVKTWKNVLKTFAAFHILCLRIPKNRPLRAN